MMNEEEYSLSQGFCFSSPWSEFAVSETLVLRALSFSTELATVPLHRRLTTFCKRKVHIRLLSWKYVV